MKAKLIAAAAAALLTSTIANAAEINLLASGAMREALLELMPQFEKASEHKIKVTWAGTLDINKRLNAGETFDLVIMAANGINAHVKTGALATGSQTDLVKSGIGVAVKAGAPRPDVSSGEAVKKALLAAKTVGYSTGPSGVYMQGLFQKMGIADQIKAKGKQTPTGVLVATIVASGDAELGFQQVSELVHEKGIDFIGPLPADIQHITVFSAAVPSKAAQPDAAKALEKFLTAPAQAPAIKKHGLDPA